MAPQVAPFPKKKTNNTIRGAVNSSRILEARVPYAFRQVNLKFPQETKGLISVIIPIYNTKESQLMEALDSVIAQIFENWEAILVNDGSTDKTVEKICAEYAGKDSRFKYVSKNNEGTLLARKAGLENSKGEFIANLDPDDAYCPQFLEKMLAKIKEDNYDFVWCGYKGKTFSHLLNAQFSGSKLENCIRYADFGVPTWNKLIKRSIYAKILFPQIHMVSDEDIVQLLQIMYHSRRASRIPEVLYLYRDQTRSASNIQWKDQYAQESFGAVVIYLLMEQLFNAEEAEKHFAFMRHFLNYFILSKEEITRYEMQYAENFIPAFIRGVKKSNMKFIKKIIFILTYKGYTMPYRIYCRILQIRHKFL